MITFLEFEKFAIENWGYMRNLHRSSDRVKRNGEVFTPMELVEDVLQRLNDVDRMSFTIDKTFLDPACGDGQFLAAVLWYKLTVQHEINKLSEDADCTEIFKKCLSTIYGVDIMPDNVELCKRRLTCGKDEFRYIVDKNIRCENALTYDFSFG